MQHTTTTVNQFSHAEERWNAFTHGLGFVLSIAGLALLVVFASLHGDALKITAAAIYGATLVLLYGSSTLYHAVTRISWKRLFQKFDHSAIYLLIAGSYTPVMLLGVGGSAGWTVFGIEWAVVAVGIALKFLFPGRFEIFSLIAYVAMGWLIVTVFGTFRAHIDPAGFWLMVAGGLAYTGGVIFYVKDNIRYFHTIWHLFVLAGSVLQFLAIFLYII
jgi:hemolysin III